jgi:hypothetical protein
MKKLVKTAKLLAVVAVVALVAVLVSSVRHPVYSQVAQCDSVNQEQCQPTNIDICQTESANYSAECNKCINPRSLDCAEGCVLDENEICVPDDSTTPNDPEPQVLAETATAGDDTGK